MLTNEDEMLFLITTVFLYKIIIMFMIVIVTVEMAKDRVWVRDPSLCSYPKVNFIPIPIYIPNT